MRPFETILNGVIPHSSFPFETILNRLILNSVVWENAFRMVKFWETGVSPTIESVRGGKESDTYFLPHLPP